VGTPLIRRTPRPGMPGLSVHRHLRLRYLDVLKKTSTNVNRQIY